MPSFAVAGADPGLLWVRPVAARPTSGPRASPAPGCAVRRPGADPTALPALIGRYVRVPPGAR